MKELKEVIKEVIKYEYEFNEENYTFEVRDKNASSHLLVKNIVTAVEILSRDNIRFIIVNEYNNWKGTTEQIDDICIMGVEI